ncbi:hypothetical protein NRP93_000955 [Clostridium botulinum]|nr:hypothetical protein [Clostridium botulinum]
MDNNSRTKIFNQWLSDLPNLIRRYVKIKKNIISEQQKKKELDYLLDRRMSSMNEIRTKYQKTTTGGVLSVSSTTFPFISKFIKTANKMIKQFPEGSDYLYLPTQDLITLSINQLNLAKEKNKTSFERNWGNISVKLQKIRRKIYENNKNLIREVKENSQNEDKSKIKFQDAKAWNQNYFRPCSLPAINNRGLNDLIIDIHNADPSKVTLPLELVNTPINTIINYYSILREANQLGMGEGGCGTIGLLKLPYPIAYNFLSSNYQSKVNYENYLKSFGKIAHINLVRLIKEYPKTNNKPDAINYFIELENIYPPGVFGYEFGVISIIKEGNTYKIDSIQTMPEDFFCAPYHYWQHNAELSIEVMYNNWCKLISTIYPTIETNFTKHIYVYGTDGNNYLFVFMKLTNGTDFRIGQYILDDSGNWEYLDKDPCATLQK